MREIKFRLRDRHNKIVGFEKWYVGEWKKDEGENFHPDSGYYVAQPCWLYSTDNKRWTPTYIPHRYKDCYTGLKDKNGVEIYEGDILNYYGYDGNDAIVEWDSGRASFVGRWVTPSPRDASALHWRPDTCGLSGDNSRVIGNIYENKELLGGT